MTEYVAFAVGEPLPTAPPPGESLAVTYSDGNPLLQIVVEDPTPTEVEQFKKGELSMRFISNELALILLVQIKGAFLWMAATLSWAAVAPESRVVPPLDKPVTFTMVLAEGRNTRVLGIRQVTMKPAASRQFNTAIGTLAKREPLPSPTEVHAWLDALSAYSIHDLVRIAEGCAPDQRHKNAVPSIDSTHGVSWFIAALRAQRLDR